MHHYLSKPDWLNELNEALVTLGAVRRYMDFDKDFELVEEDYLNGTSPEDVARRIHEGKHRLATRSEFFA